ncbi:hypothetical protein CSC62_05245 [Pseudoxanthomonas jiangsuensis]|uniref:hypothetical protein n=1 Tax=Pseudoxanthomonas jiangsuensis TaxID=619688 RepID=UPI0013911C2E|nr:hypothetical protein [Pseudoxanthomonas jiangsuensis]KAF1698316.1 hypothetical protein CSC62_05245 [Pseudoxanthomonas jiangsuensis]
MAEKLSERIRSEMGCWPSTSSLAAVLRECEELARRVEWAPVIELPTRPGPALYGATLTISAAAAERWGLDGKRVRLVPEAGKGGGE